MSASSLRPFPYKPERPRKNVRRLAAEKGYDTEALRNFLKKKGIQPQIPRKRHARKKWVWPMRSRTPRFQVKWTFSWLQRKFWRLVVRWERLPNYFNAFTLCYLGATISGIGSYSRRRNALRAISRWDGCARCERAWQRSIPYNCFIPRWYVLII